MLESFGLLRPQIIDDFVNVSLRWRGIGHYPAFRPDPVTMKSLSKPVGKLPSDGRSVVALHIYGVSLESWKGPGLDREDFYDSFMPGWFSCFTQFVERQKPLFNSFGPIFHFLPTNIKVLLLEFYPAVSARMNL